MNYRLNNIINKIENDQFHSPCLLDAIYIPFYDRIEYLNSLLYALDWFQNPIYVLYTKDISEISKDFKKNISFIFYGDDKLSDYILSLETFKNDYSPFHINHWDLPLKRNYAILHSLVKRHCNILLLDDDIEIPSPNHLNTCSTGLTDKNISGSLVNYYPDASVIDHIGFTLKKTYRPFLSGNFLLLNNNQTIGYFPKIYNEDRLFVIPSLLARKITHYGTVSQKKYNPIDDIKRITFQEFGEVISEGLYSLIENNKLDLFCDYSFWRNFIENREKMINEYASQSKELYKPFLQAALHVLEDISPEICIKFISDWQSDINKFEILKKRVKL